MPTIGYGERSWPNLESVAYDARLARVAIDEARTLKRLLLALASRHGGLDIDLIAFHATGPDDELVISENPATKTLHLEARRR